MELHAIDSRGHPGSFYDATSHQIIDYAINDVSFESTDLSSQPKYQLIRGDRTSVNTLLQNIGIEDDLRLSLFLNLDLSMGIAGILRHKHALDQHTLLFYHSWMESRKEICSRGTTVAKNVEKRGRYPPEATHLITSVTYGINFLLVLHLRPDAKNPSSVDDTLDRIIRSLIENGTDDKEMGDYQTQLFEKIVSHDVYSNVPELRKETCLSGVFKLIFRLKFGRESGYPIKYYLQALPNNIFSANQSFLPCFRIPFLSQSTFLSFFCVRQCHTWYPLDIELTRAFLDVVAQLYHGMELLKNFCIGDNQRVPGKHLQKQYNHVHKEYRQLSPLYQKLLVEWKHYVIDTHDDPRNSFQLQIFFYGAKLRQLLERIKQAAALATELIEKIRLVDDIQQVEFKCEKTSQHMFPAEANFNFNRPESTTSTRRETNSALSWSVFTTDERPSKMKTKSRENQKTPRGSPRREGELNPISEPSIPKRDKPTFVPTGPSQKPVEMFNILLIGETGVGKSTFINALANYLQFSTLQEALTNPTVVIPVSFLITTGFNFDEQVMYFGDCRNRDNENFNDFGQSVTQQCEKYEFNVPIEGVTRQIRIIDTPGFGDTRGIEQDQKNINHIKEYIKPYSKLDAICFLLKPNESRETIFFRVAFNQYAKLFGQDFQKKLLFCFTNARSTFYAPGNTGPILRKALSELPPPNKSLAKTNTFCFDNEAFRFLVATKNGINFDNEEIKEYDASWKTSVKEANRLLKAILTSQSD